jgi:cytoskeletal protein CcmA (bactofilin family)
MMFGKDMEKLKSFLGTQSELQGVLRIKGILRLDGAVTGRIEADQVILSETAMIKGEIVAKRIIVGGKIEGSLKATDLVEIRPKGRVNGEISTNRLLIMEGGKFNGQIEMKADRPNVLDFESKTLGVFLKR